MRSGTESGRRTAADRGRPGWASRVALALVPLLPLVAVGALAGGTAGCAGARRGRSEAPCGPVCIVEHRRAPCCRQVRIPERCERRLAYGVVPATCRERVMPEYGLCERTTYEERCVPVTTPVEVCDRCPTLVPTYDRVCVPTTGYRAVPDLEDVIEPVCCPRWDPVFGTVRVPDCGCLCDECGRGRYGTIGCHTESRHTGYRCRMQKVGERLAQVQVGERLEPYQASQESVCVPTGSRVANVVTGTHVEHRVVAGYLERVVADRRVDFRQTGDRRESIVERPCRLEAREETVRIPGYCVWVCDDPRHRHEGNVISSEEYTSLTGLSIE